MKHFWSIMAWLPQFGNNDQYQLFKTTQPVAKGDTGVTYRKENPGTIVIKDKDLEVPSGEVVGSWGRGIGISFKQITELIECEREPLVRRGCWDKRVNRSRHRSVCCAIIGALETVPELGRCLAR
jgi:hypothetical protein